MTQLQLEHGNTLSKHLEEYKESVRALSNEVGFLNEKPDRNWNLIYNTWSNKEIKKLYEEEFLIFTVQLKNKLVHRLASVEKAFAEI